MQVFDLDYLSGLDTESKSLHVLIVQDPFTSYYDAQVVEDLMLLCERLGLTPILLPFHPNGKPQHVKGFLNAFAKTAKNAAQFLTNIAKLEIPMIGLDPSMVLCYRDEYAKLLKANRGRFEVLLVNEWLESQLSRWSKKPSSGQQYTLFGHCTEKTGVPTSEKKWCTIFEHFGLSVTAQSVGCCGMAGTYGHEAQNLEHSLGIYAKSWQAPLQTLEKDKVLVTGYSCRSQIARVEQFKPKHPIQALLSIIEK
jgi:Fe-S oxidoreductase